MLSRYKYIIFDWDGTLASTADFWTKAYVSAAKDLGVDVPVEDVGLRYKRLSEGEKVYEGDDFDNFWDLVGRAVAELNKKVTLFDFEEFRRSEPTFEVKKLLELLG